jgi:hypothetical protein
MKTTIRTLAPTLTLFLSVTALTTCMYVSAHETRATWDGVDAAWIVVRSDNICGLDDPRLLSRPARIEYKRVLESTPEIKKMHEQNIDPTSPAGIQLKTQAVDRVRNAAEKARVQGGFCSVWKRISHKDGREVFDLTAQVIALL